MEIVVVSTKTKKSCSYKAVMNRLKSYKNRQHATLKNHSLKIVPNNSHSLLPAANITNHSWNFSSIPAYDQNSVLNFVEIGKALRLQEATYNYNKTQAFPYDPTKPAILSILRPEDDRLSNCGQNLKKLFLSLTMCTSLMRRTLGPM